ncbi:MAG: PQQ-binding-like beta-propeller repeat protein, partial [Candidatus Binatia bacterium]
STNFCKIATDIGTAGSVAVDEQGRVYVTSARGGVVLRFSPPFPTGPDAAGGCGKADVLGSPMADEVTVETFIKDPMNLATPSGIVRAPNGNWYASSVLTGIIAEYDPEGNFVRRVLEPPAGKRALPLSTGHPQGLAVDREGVLYYADLNLVASPSRGIGPGPNGSVRRITFDARGAPQPPEVVKDGLAFPDGLGILPGELEDRGGGRNTVSGTEWRTYAGGPRRLFFNPTEDTLTAANVAGLRKQWTFPTGAIVTASPSVARLDVPGEGRVAVAFIQSWDGNVYALRLRDGTALWRFATAPQPGATFPNAASAHVAAIDGRDRVYIPAGETVYCLDALTGTEIWRFTAGTGCADPPGLCGPDGERNEVESSPIIAGGLVFFGMDVNDRETGKGGFYAIDARDGRLVWFFDLETGSTCRPFPDDTIRRFDGYHSEQELGLPRDFLASRPGCDADRTLTGCGNVFSSAAIDEGRGLLFFASSNCDTDTDPATPIPPPPMPPYDEAIVALHLDGAPAWRWRPREVDNGDLAFGAVPNLFTIAVGGQPRDVVGLGNKDGTYYVIDRDGVNVLSGVRWDDRDPSSLPYWTTRVVPGGEAGGIIATAAVDEAAGRIYLSTAPGADALSPQRPTVHALDMNSGAVLWQNTTEANADASFAPTSAVPGVVFAGSVLGGFVRAYEAATGERLARVRVGSAVASAPAVIDGMVIVGAGIGARTGDDSNLSDASSRAAQNVTALCVPGTPLCTDAG